MKKVLPVLSFFLVLLVLTACGGTTAPSNTSTTPNKTTSAATATPPTPTPAPKPKSAADILAALKSKISTIGESFTYTEENDVNKLLGRPGQYIGKVNFKDTRIVRDGINNTGAQISVPDGGSIETFASTTDAQNRFKYIQAISKSSSLFAEYEYISGTVILRVSNELAPSKAKDYEAAFKAILQ